LFRISDFDIRIFSKTHLPLIAKIRSKTFEILDKGISGHIMNWIVNLLIVIFLFVAGCTTTKELPPPLADFETEPLPVLGDSIEIARVVTGIADYRSPLTKQVAALKLARKATENDPGNRECNLALSRCDMFVSSLIQDREEIYLLALEGYEAIMRSGGIQDDPVAAYYLAVHLGLILRHQGISAIARLPELEQALKTACRKPETDQGGPLRVLGMLYLKAPAWPKGIGDLDLALEYLGRAARDFPLHPPNHIFFAQALEEDGQDSNAKEALRKSTALLESKNDWADFEPLWRKEIESLR